MNKKVEVNPKNTCDDKVLFFADYKKLEELENTALQIANMANVDLKIEINFNPEKTRAVANILLIPRRKL